MEHNSTATEQPRWTESGKPVPFIVSDEVADEFEAEHAALLWLLDNAS